MRATNARLRPLFWVLGLASFDAAGCSCSGSDTMIGGRPDAGSSDGAGGDVDGGDVLDSGGSDVDSGGGDVDSGAGGMDARGGDVDSGAGAIDAGSGDLDAGVAIDAGLVLDAAIPVDAGPVTCMGTHPLVMGMRRYCNPGDCFCADPDACFPMGTADACCPGPILCGDPAPDAGVICMGVHPEVMGTRRFCNPGNCFCAAPDACFPTATADACCPGAIVCY